MSMAARRDLLMRLAISAQEIAAEQAIVAQHLAIVSDEPLWTAQQAADVLHLSVDTIRERGRDWGIQADLGDGIYRYIPERVRARRESQAPKT